MTAILALRGGRGAGKDTAARYLRDNYGATIYALAEPLKTVVATTFGLTNRQLYGTRQEKETRDPRWGLSPRELMQRTGDGIRSAMGQDVFVNLILETIAREAPSFAVISDARRLNEADRIREADGVLWRLHYTSETRPVAQDPHPSEMEWLEGSVDLEIHPGAGGLRQLHQGLDQAIEMFSRGMVAATPRGAVAAIQGSKVQAQVPLFQVCVEVLNITDPDKAPGPDLDRLAGLTGATETCWQCRGSGEWVAPVSRYGCPSRCTVCHGTWQLPFRSKP